MNDPDATILRPLRGADPDATVVRAASVPDRGPTVVRPAGRALALPVPAAPPLPQAPPLALQPGSRLHEIRIDGVLGEGGFREDRLPHRRWGRCAPRGCRRSAAASAFAATIITSLGETGLAGAVLGATVGGTVSYDAQLSGRVEPPACAWTAATKSASSAAPSTS